MSFGGCDEFRMMTEYDFSALPDVVWVDVLTRLSVGDRARLALACRRLNDAFNHPSVWYRVDVNLVGTLPLSPSRRRRVPARYGVVAPDRYVSMIRRFGAYFQDVRLTVRGEVCELQESCREVLEQLAACRLESLTLRVGEGTAQRREPSPAAADALLALIRRAQRLRSLDVRCWPVSTNCDIVASLRDNANLRRLERLSLFVRNAAEDSWVPLTTRLPPPDCVVGLVGELAALTSLSVHSALLTTRLVDVLCRPRRSQLSRLGVMVVYAGGRGSVTGGHDARFPRIDDATWTKLRTSNAAVGVELTFCNAVPSYELMSLLSAAVPVRAVAFMKYSNYTPDVLTCLAANYHRTLAKFADYGDAGGGAELGGMVGRCGALCSLVYHGAVRPSTVLDLAAARAGAWKRLELSVRWTLDHDHGDDVLCLEPATGNYAITAHLPGSMFYHDAATGERQAASYQSLCEQVSDLLGYKWRPLNEPANLD